MDPCCIAQVRGIAIIKKPQLTNYINKTRKTHYKIKNNYSTHEVIYKL